VAFHTDGAYRMQIYIFGVEVVSEQKSSADAAYVSDG
jgi:hypothetical protein